MTFKEDRWVLTVEFDTIQETIDSGNYEGGYGEAAEFYAYIRRYWEGMDEDELDEATELKGDTVRAAGNLIDSFEEPLAWLIMQSVPRSVKLQRTEAR